MPAEIPLTLIIADYSKQDSVADCFGNLSSWAPPKIVVSSNSHLKDHLRDDFSSKFILFESNSIYQLWKRGLKASKTQWNLLITSNEIVAGQLKRSVENQIKNIPATEELYKLKKKVIFLKKVLKYPLEWPAEFPSCLIFIPQTGNLSFEPGSYHSSPCLPGELIHFNESTLGNSLQEIARLAEIEADRIAQTSGSLNLAILIIKAILKLGKEIFNNMFLKKGFREGYEGIIFSILGGAVPILGLLRYFEKYVRSGRQIKDRLNSVKKILIIKLRGLGDAVIATSVIRNIDKLMPSVSISVLTFNFCKPLFENNPHLEKIYGLSEKPDADELSRLAGQLSRNNFDLILNLHARNLSSKLARKVKARWRINRSYFIREKFSDVMVGSDHALDKSSIERDLDCLRVIGLNPIEKSPELFITDDETQRARQYLSGLGVDSSKKLIVIHPAVTQPYRHWGWDRFIMLSRQLSEDYGHQVMGIFSSQEQSVANSFKEQVKEALVYAGPIRPSMALINEADLMIDNDSGPAHISAALKIPTLVLVGPDYQNTYRDKSIYKENNYVFFRDVPCRDLFFSRCLTPKNCEKLICLEHPVDEVVKKSLELLRI